MNLDIYNEIIAIERGIKPAAVLALVVETDQHSPRHASTKMLIRSNKSILGTIGGGVIEQAVIAKASLMFTQNQSTSIQKFSMNTTTPSTQKTGMLCGGDMTIYFEMIKGPDRLIIFGGGHIGKILAKLSAGSNFNVTVIDNRSDIVTQNDFPESVNLIIEDPVKYAQSLQLDPNDSIVLVTHKHRYDADILFELLKKEHFQNRYLGMIGSSKKVQSTFDQLRKNGILEDRIILVSSPIGLDIGGENPMEISISILSEIMAFRSGKIFDGTVKSMRKIASQK